MEKEYYLEDNDIEDDEIKEPYVEDSCLERIVQLVFWCFIFYLLAMGGLWLLDTLGIY